MIEQKPRRAVGVKSAVGSVRSVAVSKEAASFKRAAESYVKMATASGKAANTKLVTLGIYNAKGELTKNYRK